MKQKSLLTTILLIIGLGSYTVLNISFANGFGGNNANCQGCHGTDQNTVVTITGIPNPLIGYSNSAIYPITVTVTNASKLAAGFDIQTSDGSFLNPGAGVAVNGLTAGHTGGATAMVSGTATFNLSWQAPSTGSAIVNFVAEGNAVNLNFGNSGDGANLSPAINVPLPAKFKRVAAKQNNDQIDINFETINEENVKQFEIERSTDAINYSALTTLEPNPSNEYSATDFPSEINKTFYYRIKEISNDNTAFYSEIVPVKFLADRNIAIFPTVVENNTVSITGIDLNQNNTILLFDFMGRKVLNEKLITGQFNFPSLNKGLYFLTILENNQVLKSQKIILP